MCSRISAAHPLTSTVSTYYIPHTRAHTPTHNSFYLHVSPHFTSNVTKAQIILRSVYLHVETHTQAKVKEGSEQGGWHIHFRTADWVLIPFISYFI